MVKYKVTELPYYIYNKDGRKLMPGWSKEIDCEPKQLVNEVEKLKEK